jgi:hypothetical protein
MLTIAENERFTRIGPGSPLVSASVTTDIPSQQLRNLTRSAPILRPSCQRRDLATRGRRHGHGVPRIPWTPRAA